uniref:EF-hand domain-containing protein n=1 Tax=Quercus lobata TaxID=97700 RepID=A0A7N2MCW8_QUELO
MGCPGHKMYELLTANTWLKKNVLSLRPIQNCLTQVNLFGLPYGLSFQGMKNLLAQADINGDGVVDYEEFKQKIWNPTWPEQIEEYYETTIEDPKQGTNEENIGFRVKNAVLFPWEVEKGLWLENYSLSDYAPQIVIFSPLFDQSSVTSFGQPLPIFSGQHSNYVSDLIYNGLLNMSFEIWPSLKDFEGKPGTSGWCPVVARCCWARPDPVTLNVAGWKLQKNGEVTPNGINNF